MPTCCAAAALGLLLQGKLPAKKQLWGETLDPEKPSVAQNKITVNDYQQQQGAPKPAAAAANGGINQSYAFMKLDECAPGSNDSSGCATSCASNSVSNTPNHVSNNVTADDLEEEFDDVSAGQTWMVMEYADKGCLQVGGRTLPSVELHHCPTRVRYMLLFCRDASSLRT